MILYSVRAPQTKFPSSLLPVGIEPNGIRRCNENLNIDIYPHSPPVSPVSAELLKLELERQLGVVKWLCAAHRRVRLSLVGGAVPRPDAAKVRAHTQNTYAGSSPFFFHIRCPL